MADNEDEQTPETESASQSDTSRRRGRSRTTSKSEPSDPKKLKFFTLVPANPGIDFVGNAKKGMLFGLSLVLLTIAMMVFNVFTTGSALNYGIDFQGGSSVRLALSEEPDIERIRTVLEDAGYSGSSAVSVPDADNEVLIKVKEVLSISDDDLAVCRDALTQLEGAQLLEDGFTHPADSSKIFMKFTAQPTYADIERLMTAAGCEGTAEAGVGKAEEFPVEYALIGVGAEISKVLDREFGAGTVDHVVASETVGAKVGSQLRADGVKAMLFAIFFIFLYVMLRFDLRFAPGGIVALAHDAVVVVGAFAITGKEFNLQTIAAILTVIGYSINDTIVVFDRVRERVALHRDAPVRETTNIALNETLSRTTLTSATTLLVVVATWALGTGTIKDFAFALFVGIVAGTFSSLFIASPVFLWINDKMYKGKGHLLGLDEPEKESGTGTLLGPQTEAPEQGELDGEQEEPAPSSGAAPRRSRAARPARPAEAEPEDEEAVGEGEGPQASADVEAAAEGERAADQLFIEDVDKQASERKTRRRRRKPKED